MSTRRKAGDHVYKVPGAGFTGEAFEIVVGGEAEDWCFYDCGDPNCKEWSDCFVPKYGDYVYHVSECQMQDLPKEEKK